MERVWDLDNCHLHLLLNKNREFPDNLTLDCVFSPLLTMSWVVDSRVAVLLPVSLITISLIRRLLKKNGSGQLLPPGPPQLPVVGNALATDSKEPWKTYAEWGAKYGDLLYVRFFNRDVVVINSEKIAKDLLEKRSSNYSSRPYIATLVPFGWDNNFVFTPYGNEWRLARRLFHQSFRAEGALNFRPMQICKTHQLLMNLLETPQNHMAHMGAFAASVIMSATYDYEMGPSDESFLRIVEGTLSGLRYMTPETTVVLNAFPFLLNLPAWFPGANLKRSAISSLKYVNEMIETPLRHVEKSIAAGTAGPSMVFDLMKRKEQEQPDRVAEFDQALRRASWASFTGGTETTGSILLYFVLAMVLHPHVQERARAEIDAVVGKDRLPDFDDQPSLPYIEAIAREVVRWQPIVPLGVAHATTDSDVYEGYYIPKGATVVANAWAMSRNETLYPNASQFIPERFLDNQGQLVDPESPNFSFGFGRRICPGRHIGEASVWAVIASTLAVFEFSKGKDAVGKDIDFVPTSSVGLTRHPDPFPCRITPRLGMDAEKLARLMDSTIA
ncbi:cytochrome P450 [Leucogyrophana mollusca]|uniref:Cytochrome P450 n=1 Tax=Leucogyrophana mollusca TaxID=85980 RepID=A0ACB8BE44_9AGAM|nr:cytochrome P450 [Leucogyrophana mollusca]